MLLFITKFLNGDFIALERELIITLVPYIIVLVAMIVDFISGVAKARSAGVARVSTGYRRTGRKFLEYFSILLLATLLDVLFSIIEPFSLPFFTFLVAAFLVFCEVVSVREKTESKAIKNDIDLKLIIAAIQGKSDLKEEILKLIEDSIRNKE